MSDIPYVSTELEPSPCHICGKVNQAATGTDGRGRPKPGDVSLCIGCGSIGVYDQGAFGLLKTRAPTLAEAEEILADSEVQKLVATWLLMNNQQSRTE